MEKLFLRHPGRIRAAANPANGRLHLEWQPGACDLMEPFAARICRFGYVAAPAGAAAGDHERRRLAARMGLCGAFALNAMGFCLPIYLGMPADFEFAGLFRLVAFLSATLVDAGGRRVFHRSRVARAAGGRAAHRSADRTRPDLRVCRVDRRLGARAATFDVLRFRRHLRVSDAGRALAANRGRGPQPAAVGPPPTGARGRAAAGDTPAK